MIIEYALIFAVMQITKSNYLLIHRMTLNDLKIHCAKMQKKIYRALPIQIFSIDDDFLRKSQAVSKLLIVRIWKWNQSRNFLLMNVRSLFTNCHVYSLFITTEQVEHWQTFQLSKWQSIKLLKKGYKKEKLIFNNHQKRIIKILIDIYRTINQWKKKFFITELTKFSILDESYSVPASFLEQYFRINIKNLWK